MKTTCICILTLFFSANSWGQANTPDYTKSIKLYNESTFSTFENRTGSADSTSNYLLNTGRSVRVFQPRLAFRLKTKRSNYHEIELSELRITENKDETRLVNDKTSLNEPSSGMHIREFYFSARYEFTYALFKKKESKLKPSIGMAFSPYVLSSNRKPLISNAFTTSTNTLGASIYLVPRVTYDMSSRWYLDFNLPISLVEMQLSRNRVENPAFTVDQQTNTTTDISSLPNIFNLRIGMGYKF